MEESPTTKNEQPPGRGVAIAIGALGLVLLLLGWNFPVFNGELHPAVVAKAAERDDQTRESIAQFGLQLDDKQANPFNPEAARIVLMAADIARGNDEERDDPTTRLAQRLGNDDRVKERKRNGLDQVAMKHWLLTSKREELREAKKIIEQCQVVVAKGIQELDPARVQQVVQQLNTGRDPRSFRILQHLNQMARAFEDPVSKKRIEDVFLIIDITKKMPVLKEDLLDPAIMLTAWLHQHGLVCDSLADELLSRARDESNIAGLKRFFRSVGTLGDLLNNHQLQELMKVIPDIDTLENLSHIAMVQAKLPYFHSIGNHDDKIVKDELNTKSDEPINKHFKDFDTNEDEKISMEEWLLKGFMPLEACNFPLTYTAVIWAANQPANQSATGGVNPRAAKRAVEYLMQHGMRGDEYLRQAMSHGRGSLDFVLQRNQPISERSTGVLGTLATFSLRSPAAASVVRYLLMILGVLLLVRCWNLLAPVTLATSHGVRYHRWGRQAVAISFMLLLVMASEPALFSRAYASEYEVAVKLPIAEDAVADDEKINQNPNQIQTMIAAWNTTDIVLNVVMTLIFLAIQVAVYFMCVRKIKEIDGDPDASPRLKLTLLENEDNLFDMGLYIGIGGTAFGLGLILLGAFEHPIAAYASNVFGIICVAVVKIWHVRGVKQKLHIQCSNSEAVPAEA